MESNWTRTSFRVSDSTRENLETLKERSGFKIKKLLDVAIRKSDSSGMWDQTEGKVSPSYRKCLELEGASRVTYEISADGLRILSKIAAKHPDLSRDQIINLIVTFTDFTWNFPLRPERRRLAKMKPLVRELAGLRKRMARKLRQNFPKSNHIVYSVIGWQEFEACVEQLLGGFEYWSSDEVTKANPEHPGERL